MAIIKIYAKERLVRSCAFNNREEATKMADRIMKKTTNITHICIISSGFCVEKLIRRGLY